MARRHGGERLARQLGGGQVLPSLDGRPKHVKVINYQRGARRRPGQIRQAARGADVVLHLTEWEEFRELEPEVLSEVVNERRIVDGRNALDREKWRDAGWTYRALGRS